MSDHKRKAAEQLRKQGGDAMSVKILDCLKQQRNGLRPVVLRDKVGLAPGELGLFHATVWTLIDERLIRLTPEHVLQYNSMVE